MPGAEGSVNRTTGLITCPWELRLVSMEVFRGEWVGSPRPMLPGGTEQLAWEARATSAMTGTAGALVYEDAHHSRFALSFHNAPSRPNQCEIRVMRNSHLYTVNVNCPRHGDIWFATYTIALTDLR
jgi:hypothetical protein